MPKVNISRSVGPNRASRIAQGFEGFGNALAQVGSIYGKEEERLEKEQKKQKISEVSKLFTGVLQGYATKYGVPLVEDRTNKVESNVIEGPPKPSYMKEDIVSGKEQKENLLRKTENIQTPDGGLNVPKAQQLIQLNMKKAVSGVDPTLRQQAEKDISDVTRMAMQMAMVAFKNDVPELGVGFMNRVFDLTARKYGANTRELQSVMNQVLRLQGMLAAIEAEGKKQIQVKQTPSPKNTKSNRINSLSSQINTLRRIIQQKEEEFGPEQAQDEKSKLQLLEDEYLKLIDASPQKPKGLQRLSDQDIVKEYNKALRSKNQQRIDELTAEAKRRKGL